MASYKCKVLSKTAIPEKTNLYDGSPWAHITRHVNEESFQREDEATAWGEAKVIELEKLGHYEVFFYVMEFD
jgi:hypothetical protein